MSKIIKDPVSCLTHMAFAMLALPCAAVLISLACVYGTVWHIVSLAIFGLTLFLLYFASAAYHLVPAGKKLGSVLRKLDHMMIFVLIAGTYTPVCLVPLRGPWGVSLLVVIWAMAIAGVLFKAFWMNSPRVLTSAVYVIMGWVALAAFYPLVNNMPLMCVWLLLLGGVTYSVGAVIYALKWPGRKAARFGFHEIFHIFVMCGSVLHIIMMFFLIWLV